MRQLLRAIIFVILIVGAITLIKTSVSTNKTNNEHTSLDKKPDITKKKIPFSTLSPERQADFHTLAFILGFIIALLTALIFRFICYPFCKEQCQRWISRFFRRTRPEEMPVREREIELVHMPQRQEEIHNLPPSVIETDV